MSKVYVGNLSRDTNERDLERAFEKFGRVNHVWIASNPPGFAFVEMNDRRDAEEAVDELDGREIRGNRVRVEFSRGKRSDRDRGDRGARGDRDRGDRHDSRRYRDPDTKCFNCNGFGHWARDCPKKRNKGECYNCGEFGHQSRECSKRKVSVSPKRSRSRGRSHSRSRSQSGSPRSRRSPSPRGRRSNSPQRRTPSPRRRSLSPTSPKKNNKSPSPYRRRQSNSRSRSGSPHAKAASPAPIINRSPGARIDRTP